MVGWVLFGVRLGAVSCCLGCVPAHFNVVESDALVCCAGFAGKEILKEEGGKRLTPSSTCCDRVNVDGEF
jgi:hypothetical protein